MKSLRFMLYVVLVSLSTVAFAQSDAQKSDAQNPAAQSDAQKSFTKLKALAGTWHASITTDPPMKEMGNGAMGDVTMRITSRGNALVH
jgi:nitrate reductase cytochrome c-type subunit